MRAIGTASLDRLDYREFYTEEVPLDTLGDLTSFHFRQREINKAHDSDVKRLSDELGKIKMRLAAIEKGARRG